MPRPTVLLTLIGLVASIVFSATLVPFAGPAQATPPAGTGGMFTPLQGRLVDSRVLSDGVPAGALLANTNYTYQVTGEVGVPSTGVSAVMLSVTALTPNIAGNMCATANPASCTAGSTVLTWAAGETVSNASVVALTSNGQIIVNSNMSTENITIDVQGYFLTGNGTAAPGGYVPVAPSLIVDTRSGVGAPQAKVATGSSLTVQATGVGGVPASASGVFVNIAVVNQAALGWIEPYPTGTTRPLGSLNFPATTTAFGVNVHVNASGQASIYVGGGGPLDVTVEVEGYFSGTNGATGAAGSFTALQHRVLDTRGGTKLAGGAVTTLAVAGIDGVPAAGSGVAAVSLNVTAWDLVPATTGYLRLWDVHYGEPNWSALPYNYDVLRSDLIVVPVASDGTIKIRNTGTAAIDVIVDVQGWYASSTALPQASGTQCSASGTRAGSQPVTHQLSDSTSMSLNPTNGNLALSGSLLHLRGVGQDLSIGWRYNGINDTRPSLNTGLYEDALQPWDDGSFTYVAPDGGCYHFTPKNGSTWPVGPDTNAPPAGINATMYSPAAGTMALRFNPSGVVNTYVKTTGVYQLTSTADKNVPGANHNPNMISYTYTGGELASIKDTQARVVTFAYTDVNNPYQPSSITDTSLSRTISLVYGGTAGALSQITDATGAVTTLGYDATGLISLTNNGNQTSFGYDTSSRATSWTYGAGSAVASNWTAAYATNTTITDGNGNAATYTISGSTTTDIKDPLSNHVGSFWDGHDNLHQRTDAMGNLTTNLYASGTNIHNLLAQATNPAGTTGDTPTTVVRSFATTPTGALGDFQPDGTTDAQANTSAIIYDTGFTNQQKSVTYKDSTGTAIGGTRSSTFQGDGAGTSCGALTGEVCTTSNGNSNVTSYGYTNGNPTSITPPAPLVVRVFTYDGAGRVLSAQDGRGNTAYYTYDGNDRITQVSYTAGSCPAATCVSYTYDGAGNLTGRTSPTGLTSIGYDALNRPTTKTQAGVLVATATYDPASNLTSYADTSGTIHYGYDTANNLVSLAEPGGSCPTYPTPVTANTTACTGFSYNKNNERTVTTSPSGQTSTTSYDGAGRVASNIAKTAAPASATLASRVYTYQNAIHPLVDQALVGTMTDQAGTVTTYSYDGLNRLQSAAQPGTSTTWLYDNDGNRTKATTTGTGAGTVYSAYNGADQLCWTSTVSAGVCASPPTGATTYAYDASGNQTGDQIGATTLANSFNVFNQITSTLIGGTTTLTSTYADTSNTERLTAGATSFINGTLGVTSETTSGASINYIRDPSGNLIAMHTGGQSYYYTPDKQGSVIALTDAAQALAATYTYDPWGNITNSTGALATTNPWHYAGSYTDAATGYLKLGARYYNPTTGRFTQPDPSGQEANTYNYTSCNPVNSTDPTGLMSACWWEGMGIGAIFLSAPEMGVTGYLVGGADAAICGTSFGDTNNGYSPFIGPELPTGQRVQQWG